MKGRLAVVIPALDEEDSIGRVLDAIPADLAASVVVARPIATPSSTCHSSIQRGVFIVGPGFQPAAAFKAAFSSSVLNRRAEARQQCERVVAINLA